VYCCPAQIANALNYIHKKRIVHRDLKTQNIFVAKGGIIKLGDFGIAKVGRRERRLMPHLMHWVALSSCAS
jgi:NIMA (never in mitosis gene a)-related kinase